MSRSPDTERAYGFWHQRGSLVVEAAVILPVVLGMIAGLIVIGVRLSDYMFLSQAARELGVVLSRTPNMASLGASEASFVVSPSSTSNSTEATSCMQSISSAESCQGGQGTSCTSCAQTVVGWYAQQAFKLKKLTSSSNVTVRVKFAAPPSDPNASVSGLCMISVSASANAIGWLGLGASTMSVTSSVPYVSGPVPPAGQNCIS